MSYELTRSSVVTHFGGGEICLFVYGSLFASKRNMICKR